MAFDKTARDAVGAVQAQVAASPAKKVSGLDRALTFIGARRRVFGGISDDGQTLEISGSIVERLAGRTRLRSATALGGVDAYDDGSVGLPGERRSSHGGSTIRATVGPRHRFVELLSTLGYRVYGLTARANGEVAFGSLVAKPDGEITLAGERRRESSVASIVRAVTGARRRVVERLTATSYFVHGLRVDRNGAHLDLSMDGQRVARVTAGGPPQISGGVGGAITTGDAYWRDGQVMPVLTDMTKWAIWGSSTAHYFEDNLTALAAQRGATCYAGGQGGERIEHHTARLGSHPALLTFPANTIPASGWIDLPLPAGWTRSGSLLTYSGIVAGVAGTLSTGAADNLVRFTRTDTGSEVVTTAGAVFTPDDGMLYRAAFNFFNLGKNSITSGRAASEVIQITKEAYAWLSPLVSRTLVGNHFIDTDTAVGSATYQRVLDVNAGLAAAFGSHLVDIYGFVCLGQAKFGQTIWDRTGITPTADDLLKQSQGLKPTGLSRDNLHLSEAADVAVTWLIDQTTLSLGYFDEEDE